MSNNIQQSQQDNMSLARNNSKPTGMAMITNTRELARIQGEIIMAKMYPREISLASRQIAADCQNWNLASQAIYQYAKGGTDIKGPSIRLAEVLARRMGNIRYGFEELETTEQYSTVRAYAYDIEANSQTERIFPVSHIRHTRKGDTLITDPIAVYEMVANQAQRRVRACILAQIPGDIVDLAVSVCEDTMVKSINLDQKTKLDLLEAFTKYRVTQTMIEKRIQRNFDAITVNQINDLRQIYTSLKGGVGTVEDYFQPDTVEEKKAEADKNPTEETRPKQEKVQRKHSDIGTTSTVAAERIAALKNSTVKKETVKETVKQDAIKPAETTVYTSPISEGFQKGYDPQSKEWEQQEEFEEIPFGDNDDPSSDGFNW